MKRDVVGRTPAMSLSVSEGGLVTETEDERYMRTCLTLASRGKGYVSPNPLVGAVLVTKGKIVAEGYHRKFGGPHAEVECLRSFRGDTSEATLYVNLEPCTHYGKTPPCVDLILQRGIRRVVVGMKDPNPLVAGKGIRRLRRAGVKVRVGALRHEAEELNRFFVKHITTGMPYVHVKIAQTQDGYIGRVGGTAGYITSQQSLKMVHRWRAEYDAILVGANTVKADNPRLDVRLVPGRDPAVIIVDGRFSLAGTERVLRSASRRPVYVCTTEKSLAKESAKAAALRSLGIRILTFKTSSQRLDLRRVLTSLYREGIGSILVEGGSDIFSQCIEKNLVDELTLFTAPKKFLVGLPALTPLARKKVDRWIARRPFVSRTIGVDHVLTGRIS